MSDWAAFQRRKIPVHWLWIGCVSLVLLVGILYSLLKPSERKESVQSLSSFLSDIPSDYFAKAVKGKQISFPTDHGAHPDFRQEWWYYTGNLVSDSGDLFGYQLTIFRFALPPQNVSLDSKWQTSSTWMAHFAITDVTANQFYFTDDFSRGALGLAGTKTDPFSVWLNRWSVKELESTCSNCLAMQLKAGMGDIEIDLQLKSSSPPVLQGDNGFSKKNADGTVASYYYSYPSLGSSGTIRIGETVHSVTGSSWMDREWSSAVLAKGQSGWDWFALHLDAHTQLMLFQVRDSQNPANTYRTAHLIRNDGDNVIFESESISMTEIDWWKSPTTGSNYPVAWQFSSEKKDASFSITVRPQIQNQELDLAFRYYEGAVFVEGEVIDKEIKGKGYMELTGYE